MSADAPIEGSGVNTDFIIDRGDQILVTGASGFLGGRLIEVLAEYGCTRIRCFVRPSSNLAALKATAERHPALSLEIVAGNLLNADDCRKAATDVAVVYHLAAGTGDKSYAGAFLNSVVTTRNLLDALRERAQLRRFVNVSSFSVYGGLAIQPGAVLDETCGLESDPQARAEAYCYGKLKQDELVTEYGVKYGLPYVIVRPSVIYGPGRTTLTGRVGIATFGLYLHIGGSNRIPLTYVDNCADAIARAGLVPGVEGQVFNVVDDDLPRSHTLLKMYKKHVRQFRSLYLPHQVTRLLCIAWERYSAWSRGQLPPAFNRRRWAAYWQGNEYSNLRLKQVLGWSQRVPTETGLMRFFGYCRQASESK
jgi:nucleoside-diphosphate-sugar epimerase